MSARPQLNEDQAAAVAAMRSFLLEKLPPDEHPYFLLEGGAGTGKTFCIQSLVEEFRGRMIFTAPTNKATKVLRESVTSDAYKPECRTIYSLLGLQLAANGEVKELKAPEDPIDLSDFRCVVVDEGSMLNQVVMSHIGDAARSFGIKFIFMGDDCQLPPVGEQSSPIWKIKRRAKLTKVMRHDNQILELATYLRTKVANPFGTLTLTDNNAEQEGVWKVSEAMFAAWLIKNAERGGFLKPNSEKVVAWRNVTVDKWNKLIRSTIYQAEAARQLYLPGERVLFAAPAKDLEDKTVATTDDEGVVDKVDVESHPIYPEFKIFRLTITLDDNRLVVARVLHPDSQFAFSVKTEELAEAARANSRKWRHFWDFKDAFHSLRYAYAITAHRAQGSTYQAAFVDYLDILVNRERKEAMQCLYVACTRPKKQLVLG